MAQDDREVAGDGRHAVISGGEGDIARALASVLAEAGWRVETPGRAVLDVTCAESVAEYFAVRSPDLLVCNAGLTRDALLVRLDPNEWDAVWRVNFAGARACARAVLPKMMRRGGGHIVLVSSMSALRPPPGQAAYATAKAALLGLADDLAMAAGPYGVRVNAVLPGFLETRMTESVPAARRAEVLAAHRLGRLNTCAGVARFIRFLDEEMVHTSGQVFQLDSRPHGYFA